MQSRVGSLLAVYVFAMLGLFLLVTPWTPVWAEAALALLPRGTGRWVLSGWARGTASGLGAADVLVAFQIARELRRRLAGQSAAG